MMIIVHVASQWQLVDSQQQQPVPMRRMHPAHEIYNVINMIRTTGAERWQCHSPASTQRCVVREQVWIPLCNQEQLN